MKKVFACLSTVLLMLVAFGLFMQPAAKLAAVEVEEGKFIEDPTIQEGDIPIYIMNSLQTTMPNLYDSNALKDPNYGPGRDYYWSEIKLVVPKFVENAATGEQYTVYVQGSYDAARKTAAGARIYIWYEIPEGKENAGQIVTATQNGQSISWTGTYPPQFGDPSLSGIRFNVTGKEVVIDDIARQHGIGNGDHGNDVFYIIFDGNGKAVRGVAHDNYYSAEKQEQYAFNSLFGYQDGKLVLRTDIVEGAALNGFGAADEELDRVQHEEDDLDNPLVDEVTGEPVLDDDGNPMYNKKLVDGEEANILHGQRYLFQWFSEEDFDAEMVNDVQFLEEGWRYDKWDYAYADPNGGYVCLAFTAALGKFAALSDKQSEVHNASIRALQEAGELDEDAANALLIPEDVQEDEETHEETIKYGVIERPLIQSCVIPVDGISYRYGYLDYAGTAVESMHFGKFCPLFESALLYGRHEDYRAHVRTENLTATGLVAKTVAADGVLYNLREEAGELVYEIAADTLLKPSQFIDVKGMLGGFQMVGDGDENSGSNVKAVQTYKNCAEDELEYTMDINGEAVMRPIVHQYETLDQMKGDFLAALLNWKRGKGVAIAEETDWASFANNTYGKFADGDLQLFAQEVEDWAWFIEYFSEKFNAKAAAEEFTGYDLTKANGLRFGLYAFMNKIKHGSWPYSPDFTDFDTSDLVEYSPEKVFRYASWDEFVADLLLDAGTEIYGNPDKFYEEGEPDPAHWADRSYGIDPDKCAAFFTGEKWGFLGKILDEMVAAEGENYKGAAAGTSNYYRWNIQAYINKYTVGTWPYSIKCEDMADPNWIGVPLEKDYYKVQYATDGIAAPASFYLEFTALNKLTGVSGNLKIRFEVVKTFTPVIRVDASLLKVGLEQTSIDLRAAVKAYDGIYREGAKVYGSDISRQYLEFVLPEGFDPDNLTPGTFKIKAIAYAPADPAIKAEETFTIMVTDGVAPTAEARSEVYVVKGAQLKAEDILLYAHDDMVGDLFTNADWIWYLIDTDYDPMTSEIGEELDGKITIYDLNQNELVKRFTVIVTGAEGVDNSEEIEALEDRIADLEAEVAKANKLQEADAKLADIQAKIAQLESKLGEVANNAEQTVSNTTKGCKKAGMLVAGLVAAAGLVLVIFKKKH